MGRSTAALRTLAQGLAGLGLGLGCSILGALVYGLLAGRSFEAVPFLVGWAAIPSLGIGALALALFGRRRAMAIGLLLWLPVVFAALIVAGWAVHLRSIDF